MRSPELHVVVPGPLDQRTGGYLYDARMVEGLRELGWRVHVHELEGSFPDPDPTARAALDHALASLREGARVLIDGLAMGGLPGPIHRHGTRLRILSLVHHPLAEETGLSDADRRRLADAERDALRPCVGVLVSSDFTARCLEAFGVPASRVRAVTPGTDRAPMAEGPEPGRPPVLLSVASITPRKGHDVLVRALERVRELEWTCVLAGGLDRAPDHAAEVRKLVRAAGLADRIAFPGELHGPDLHDQYRRASIFVLASHYEGYGMALTEAIAHGLPVVSTTGGAIPHTVPGDAALLVEPGDDEAFGAALRTLLEPGSSTRSELASAAYRHAGALPTWSESVRAFARAITELAP